MAENITRCPVCDNPGFSDYLEVTDHFLSKERFLIRQCTACGFRFVNPRPGRSEIERYYKSEDYISHGAEKPDLVSRIYKLVRIFSIHNKYRILSKYCRPGRILDIGCGTGEFLTYCRTKGFDVNGVEPNEKARSFAQSQNKISVTSHLNLLSGKAGSFDCITLWHVLEHIHDLDETLETIKKLLTPDGVIVVAVPNNNSWDASKYKSYWAAYDVPRHLYHFTKPTFNLLAERRGFQVLKTIPQKLDAYYVSMLSEKYLTGKSNYFKFLAYGFWSNFMATRGGNGHSSLIFILSVKKT